MTAGPTTEGSIVAYLRMDASDFNAKLDAAAAKARELGRVDPNIRVKADTASALAKLDAVEAAQRRVNAATSAADTAYARAALAQMRLDDVSSKRGRTEYQVAAATLANTEAQKRLNAANEKVILSESALAEAQRKVAETAAAEALAEDANASATDRASNANKTNITRMGLIIAAVAILVPMIAPLSGYVVGVSGALAGMGAAGVLAILGIKNAMAAGTAQGAEFSARLQVLLGDLSQLEGTAATSMLSAFNTSIRAIDQAMPQLNSEISQFSSMLGVVGKSVLQGVINALRILNPLFIASGQYVERLAEGFLSWTQNGGLQRFANYAMSVLPQVEHTIGSLVAAVWHILDALAPLGTIGLMIIQGVSQTINAIPVPVLSAMAVAATAGWVSFQLWKAAPVIIAAVTAAIDGLSGPVGWVALGVTALTAVFAASMVAANQAAPAIGDYSDALARDNGVIGDNVRAQTAKALLDSGAIANAKKLGLTASQVTSAALGQAGAQKVVNDAVKKANDEYTKATRAAVDWGNSSYKSQDAAKKQAAAAAGLAAAIKAQNDAIENAIRNGIDYNAAMNIGGSVAQTMAADLGMTVFAYEKLTASQNTATAAAKTWKTELDILNGVTQSLEQTNINLATDYQTMATTIIGNIKSMGKVAATATDINTAGGLANHQIVLKAIQDAQAQSDAIIAAEGGTAKAREDGRVALDNSRQSIIDHMVALGLDRDAVTKLVDAELKIPAQVVSTIVLNTTDAYQRITALQAAIRQLPGQAQARIAMGNGSQGGLTLSDGGPVYKAAGGPIEAAYLASGGNPFAPRGTDTVPAMLTPGEFVVRQSAAAYDPQFLKAYNQNPQKALDSVAGSRGTTVNNNNFTIHGPDSNVVANDVLRRLALTQSAAIL